MQLFYDPHITGPVHTLSESESKHVVRVLRKTVGDEIHLIDGKGTRYHCRITADHPKRCGVEVVSEVSLPLMRPEIHVAIAPTKLNDRLEWFLEKATEIGITAITPVICEHSERKTVKRERLEKVLVAAMKQSLKAWLPRLHPATTFRDFVTSENNGQRYIAHCDGEERTLLKAIYPKGDAVQILIGPEGDFSPTEIELANAHGFQPITLGESRLRTETAALVALQTIHVLNQ